MNKKEIIETATADNVETLIKVLKSFTRVTDPSAIYVEGSHSEPIKLSLQEETLSDGSIVYNVIVSEVRP